MKTDKAWLKNELENLKGIKSVIVVQLEKIRFALTELEKQIDEIEYQIKEWESQLAMLTENQEGEGNER